MLRRCLTHALPAVVMLASAPALAQDPNCPPGSWFCEEVEAEALPPAEAEAAPEAAPEQAAPPQRQPRPGARAPLPPPAHRSAPPPVVVYQPPGGPQPQVVIVTPSGQPPPRVVVRTMPAVPPAPPAPPPPPKHRWRSEWGINLRLEGISLGRRNGAAEDAGMGGLGLSLRYRPVPAFALDFGVDVVGGIDYNGDKRSEIPVSLSAMLFVNPRSRVQFYFMGGLHASHAQVERTSILLDADGQDTGMTAINEVEYDYFGGQGGIGLEFRLSRRVALNIDALGFIRNRTDDNPVPEFTDPDTGRTTNTSGGGMFRGGISFYW